MNNNLLMFLPELTNEELIYLQTITRDMTESQIQQFANMYRMRRKDPQTILICTLLGLVVVAGIQRFMLGQTGMGVLYLFTGGLCLIGTIVDLVNYQKNTLQYNQRQGNEVLALIKMNVA